jgi:hypothetical protein
MAKAAIKQATVIDAPPHCPSPAYDSRFRRLLSADTWADLRPAIQQRFSRRVEGGGVKLYAGQIIATRFNWAGRVLAQLCRLIGAPLPLHDDADVPAVVVVSEDKHSGGQCWTRLYHRHRGPPQLINSIKAFAGPTGLEELLGGGIGMALRIEAAPDRLVFVSDHYFWRFAGWRLRLPAWVSPGETRVTHRDLGNGRFAFDLIVRHPWLGTLIDQHALFDDR